MKPGIVLTVSAVLLLSCAGGPRPGESPPSWVSAPPEASDSELFFRGTAGSGTIASAREAAIAAVIDSVIGEMNIGDPALRSDPARTAVNQFRKEMETAIRTPELTVLDGMTVLAGDAWKTADDEVFYGISISWDRQAFALRADELAELTGAGTLEYRDFEKRGGEAEIDGNIYEAALIWAAAAGVARNNGNTPGYRRALDEVERTLSGLEYALVSVPPEVYADTPPSVPFVFQAVFKGRPVGSAEFVVGYPGGKVRLVSDSNGRVAFLPPPLSSEGSPRVTMAPSADPFLEYLHGERDSYADALILSLETPRIDAVYEVQQRVRRVPTGILILETDLAGNPLNSTAASGGLADDLIADGFNVSVMELDPRKIMEGGEGSLLRELKADSRFSRRYRRVIHGTVSLESFERDGGSYTVRVSGTLRLSDIEGEATVHQSVITKTSRAGDGQQAMSAAFRQIGRSFAAELIDLAP